MGNTFKKKVEDMLDFSSTSSTLVKGGYLFMKLEACS
jgi:hypothetical protein